MVVLTNQFLQCTSCMHRYVHFTAKARLIFAHIFTYKDKQLNAKFQYCKDNIELNKHNPKEMWKNINRVMSGRGRHSKLPQYPQ